jgi:hypothetical protein
VVAASAAPGALHCPISYPYKNSHHEKAGDLCQNFLNDIVSASSRDSTLSLAHALDAGAALLSAVAVTSDPSAAQMGGGNCHNVVAPATSWAVQPALVKNSHVCGQLSQSAAAVVADTLLTTRAAEALALSMCAVLLGDYAATPALVDVE